MGGPPLVAPVAGPPRRLLVRAGPVPPPPAVAVPRLVLPAVVPGPAPAAGPSSAGRGPLLLPPAPVRRGAVHGVVEDLLLAAVHSCCGFSLPFKERRLSCQRLISCAVSLRTRTPLEPRSIHAPRFYPFGPRVRGVAAALWYAGGSLRSPLVSSPSLDLPRNNFRGYGSVWVRLPDKRRWGASIPANSVSWCCSLPFPCRASTAGSSRGRFLLYWALSFQVFPY